MKADLCIIQIQLQSYVGKRPDLQDIKIDHAKFGSLEQFCRRFGTFGDEDALIDNLKAYCTLNKKALSSNERREAISYRAMNILEAERMSRNRESNRCSVVMVQTTDSSFVRLDSNVAVTTRCS